MKILTNFKVFSQNTNRFVHESVFIIFHEQMNIHEQMNMNNEQYMHANRMVLSSCTFVNLGLLSSWLILNLVLRTDYVRSIQ